MDAILSNSWLMLALLNPFLLIIYLTDLVDKFTLAKFRNTLIVAGVIAIAVFVPFSLLGDYIFSTVIRAHFASFQMFGGIVFLLIGLQFVFQGPGSLELLRGDRQAVASSIAMPILIGPGTLSAAVLIGKRLPALLATISVVVSVSLSIGIIVLLKYFFDIARPKQEQLLERYVGVAGRILALYAGTVAIEMIMNGLTFWVQHMILK